MTYDSANKENCKFDVTKITTCNCAINICYVCWLLCNAYLRYVVVGGTNCLNVLLCGKLCDAMSGQ
eukprot:149837-Amphidinium_carterae.1